MPQAQGPGSLGSAAQGPSWDLGGALEGSVGGSCRVGAQGVRGGLLLGGGLTRPGFHPSEAGFLGSQLLPDRHGGREDRH